MQVTAELLESHADGLILLAGGAAGPVGAAVLRGDMAGAEALLRRLRAAFGDRVYVELQRHGLENEQASEAGLVEPGYRLLANIGGHGHQEVPHLHVHVFGGRQMGLMLPR